ncbi:MAG: substrate-binding domain-containing protein [gamma proteobacterium symbiont of Taylorina sp.]|nr:substrate-binding domain-containing protein [gamma proteobacterium symbiont of Taylorina sp.]
MIIKRSLIIFFFIVFLIPIDLMAESDVTQSDIAFSDPSQIEAMPEQWQEKPIFYKNLPADTDLAITLDQQLYPALVPLIKEYAKKHHLRIAVSEGTCGISAGALMDKNVDIGGFCCPAGETDRLPGLKYHTLAIAAIALLVHPDNNTINISSAQARNIFSGNIGNWDELNTAEKTPPVNPSLSVQPVARLHCKTRPGHWRLILENEDEFSATLDEVATIPDMITHVSRDRQVIGYETLWMTRLYEKQIGRVGLLNINDHSPEDNQAIINGQYPFYRTFNLSSWTSPHLQKQTAKDLVQYIQNNFSRVDAKYAFIPAAQLKKSGWLFSGDELTGEPQAKK